MRQYKAWTAAVPVEREADVLLLHDYDGIHELDNKLPPWWVAMFYITIAFAGVSPGLLSLHGHGSEFPSGIRNRGSRCREQVANYLAKQANLIDESNVTLLTDEAALEAGKAIFVGQCAACHGQLGRRRCRPEHDGQLLAPWQYH